MGVRSMQPLTWRGCGAWVSLLGAERIDVLVRFSCRGSLVDPWVARATTFEDPGQVIQ